MIEQIVVALMLGVAVGIVTGLIPGLHVNLLSTILYALSASILAYISPLALASFIIAISITHTFIEFITATYLGAPDDSTALAILPGHKMLLEGKGYQAVLLCLLGAWGGLISLILIAPLFIMVIPLIFSLLSSYIGILLMVISTIMILREETIKGKLSALAVYLGAGALGCAVFALDIKQPLFVLLSGIFGLSTIVTSLAHRVTIPKQIVTKEVPLKKREIGQAIASGLASSGILSIFPGLGPAQAAIIATQFYKKITDEAYLVVIGSINTVSMAMSLLTLYAIDKARNGSIVMVDQILPKFGIVELILALLIALCAGSLAFIVTLFIARKCSAIFPRLPYAKLSLGVIAFIFLLGYILSGIIGVFVLIISMAVGMLPMLLGIGRHHAMGVLLLPIILYFML